METKQRPILELSVNGDPYGRGYVATEFRDATEAATRVGIYRGDIGARPRSFWRAYARRNGYVLRFEP